MLNINPSDFVLKPFYGTIHCEPNWQWKKRENRIPNYDLFYIWSGEGKLVLNGKSYDVAKGHCFLFKPGDQTSATQSPQNRLKLTYIHFDITVTSLITPSAHRIIGNTISFESLLTQYIRLCLIKEYGSEIEAKLILKQLMIHLLREDQEKEKEVLEISNSLLETIQEIANYVQVHPSERHSIASLAVRANLSPQYFSQKFKQYMGHTIKFHIVSSRIKRAEHLLHYSGMTVTETAYALGYNDLHFFSRQFKKYTGKNPSEIR
ncbi:AraC family transcriptional regulator [Sporosarcina sp. G11-34]|uniref:AraC family transcriptional regulator n=1 Tax=Sporosarcina sp. G11-34 TaxID=2849605 RepID=UPI0022A951B5|nr:AraC family transcriptional regulator [Sporosarcina sp. G11-34]MCZ2260862.1 AraC family transcriptional regulator [Sporosarcina sp. G11-34]